MKTWDCDVEKDNEERLQQYLRCNDEPEIEDKITFSELESEIHLWAKDRSLHHNNAKTQVLKTCEEVGELAKAVNEHDYDKIVDAVGDITITLLVFCLQQNLDFVECLEYAYNHIKDRKGKTIDGNFIKK